MNNTQKINFKDAIENSNAEDLIFMIEEIESDINKIMYECDQKITDLSDKKEIVFNFLKLTITDMNTEIKSLDDKLYEIENKGE